MNDYTNDIAYYWPTIMTALEEHGDKHPIIECNLFERKVYAYPAKDFINTLSERTRITTLQQYEQVTAEGGLMVFINDSENRILQSYIFNASDIEPQRKRKKTTKRISKNIVESGRDISKKRKERRTSA